MPCRPPMEKREEGLVGRRGEAVPRTPESTPRPPLPAAGAWALSGAMRTQRVLLRLAQLAAAEGDYHPFLACVVLMKSKATRVIMQCGAIRT